MKRNFYGKKLGDNVKPVVTDNRFLDRDGRIDWKKYGIYIDDDGFDTRYETEEVVLKKGTRICRFGSPNGLFTTTAGTAYEEVSLPYDINTVEYHEYIVKKDMAVHVIKGVVAADFDLKGGGVQYKHLRPIKDDINEKNLKEEYLWVLRRIVQH